MNRYVRESKNAIPFLCNGLRTRKNRSNRNPQRRLLGKSEHSKVSNCSIATNMNDAETNVSSSKSHPTTEEKICNLISHSNELSLQKWLRDLDTWYNEKCTLKASDKKPGILKHTAGKITTNCNTSNNSRENNNKSHITYSNIKNNRIININHDANDPTSIECFATSNVEAKARRKVIKPLFNIRVKPTNPQRLDTGLARRRSFNLPKIPINVDEASIDTDVIPYENEYNRIADKYQPRQVEVIKTKLVPQRRVVKKLPKLPAKHAARRESSLLRKLEAAVKDQERSAALSKKPPSSSSLLKSSSSSNSGKASSKQHEYINGDATKRATGSSSNNSYTKRKPKPKPKPKAKAKTKTKSKEKVHSEYGSVFDAPINVAGKADYDADDEVVVVTGAKKASLGKVKSTPRKARRHESAKRSSA